MKVVNLLFLMELAKKEKENKNICQKNTLIQKKIMDLWELGSELD